MKKVNVHQAKTNLSSLLREVEKLGKKIVICRYNVPIEEIVPVTRKKLTIPVDELKAIRFIAPPELPTGEEWDLV